jgi:hypothetical protein
VPFLSLHLFLRLTVVVLILPVLLAVEAVDPSHRLLEAAQEARRKEKQLSTSTFPSCPHLFFAFPLIVFLYSTASSSHTSSRRSRLTNDLAQLRSTLFTYLKPTPYEATRPFQRYWVDAKVGYPDWAREEPLRGVWLAARLEVLVGSMEVLVRVFLIFPSALSAVFVFSVLLVSLTLICFHRLAASTPPGLRTGFLCRIFLPLLPSFPPHKCRRHRQPSSERCGEGL